MSYSIILVDEGLREFTHDSLDNDTCFSLTIDNLGGLDLPDLSSDFLIIASKPKSTADKDILESIMKESDATLVVWGDVESANAVDANCCFTPNDETVEPLRNEGLPSFYLPFTTEDGSSNLCHIINQANKGADGEYLYHYGTTSPISYEEAECENAEVSEKEVSYVKDDKSEQTGKTALIVGGLFNGTEVKNAIAEVDMSNVCAIVLVSPSAGFKGIDLDVGVPVYRVRIDLESILSPCVGASAPLLDIAESDNIFNESVNGYQFMMPFLMDIIQAQGYEFDSYIFIQESYQFNENEVRDLASTLDELSVYNDTANVIVSVLSRGETCSNHVSMLNPDNAVESVIPAVIGWSMSPDAVRFFNRLKLALGWSIMTGSMGEALSMAVNTATKAITCFEINTGGRDE